MALGIVKKSAEALANVMGPLLEGSLPHHLITSPLCAEATRVVPYREARDQVRALDFGSIEEFRMWQSDNPGLGIPAEPHTVYLGKGWHSENGYCDFFGVEMLYDPTDPSYDGTSVADGDTCHNLRLAFFSRGLQCIDDRDAFLDAWSNGVHGVQVFSNAGKVRMVGAGGGRRMLEDEGVRLSIFIACVLTCAAVALCLFSLSHQNVSLPVTPL